MLCKLIFSNKLGFILENSIFLYFNYWKIVSKPGAWPKGTPKGLQPESRLLILPRNIRLGMKNALAYYNMEPITTVKKSFIEPAHGD